VKPIDGRAWLLLESHPALAQGGHCVRDVVVRVAMTEPSRELGLGMLCRSRGVTVRGHADAPLEDLEVDVLLTDMRRLAPNAPTTVEAVTSSGARVLVLDEGRDEQLAELLRAGARGVVAPFITAEALERAVHQAVAGEIVLSPAQAERLFMSGAGRPRLTPREREVLQLAADGHSNAAIARLLFVSVDTVKTLLKRAKKKLQTRDRTHTACRARELGLM